MTQLPLVYLAAPLFSPQEREFNSYLSKILSPYAEIFLPQRDGELLTDLIGGGLPIEEAERRVFDNDARAMSRAGLLVAVLNGAHIDEGVAFEIGYMNGLRKICIGLQTDDRRALPTGNNPMIARGLFRTFADMLEMKAWVCLWCSDWEQNAEKRAA
jgi:nucleoside 2-deoxyribosyltransferase